jgi:hypothetical protein
VTEMTIPEVRDRLIELSLERGIPELTELAQQLSRKFHGRKARPRSAAMTAERTQAIREYARAHPTMSELEIGLVFGVNQGRVSEALYGKRGERDKDTD